MFLSLVKNIDLVAIGFGFLMLNHILDARYYLEKRYISKMSMTYIQCFNFFSAFSSEGLHCIFKSIFLIKPHCIFSLAFFMCDNHTFEFSLTQSYILVVVAVSRKIRKIKYVKHDYNDDDEHMKM